MGLGQKREKSCNLSRTGKRALISHGKFQFQHVAFHSFSFPLACLYGVKRPYVALIYFLGVVIIIGSEYSFCCEGRNETISDGITISQTHMSCGICGKSFDVVVINFE